MQRIRYISGRYMDINATYYTILAVSITLIKLILQNPTCIVFSRLHIIIPIIWIWTDNLPFVVEMKGIRLWNYSTTHHNLQYVHTYRVVSDSEVFIQGKRMYPAMTHIVVAAPQTVYHIYIIVLVFLLPLQSEWGAKPACHGKWC